MNFAHVKWFVDSHQIQEPPLNINEFIFVIGFVFTGLLIVKFIDKYIKKQNSIANISDRIQSLRPWMPTIARLTLALMLLYASVNNYVFVPNLETSNNVSALLLASSSVIAVLLLLGLGTRIAASAVALIYLIASVNFGFIELLDHIEILGLALLLLIEGPGKFAFDNQIGPQTKAPLKYRKQSMRIILVSAGLSFSMLAASEKLGNIDLALSFLSEHHWNFLSWANISDRHFIIFIGASELTIGLSLVLGWATRFMVIVLLGLLVTTAVLLGISEVVGHAFAVAVVAAAWLMHDLPLMRSRLR